MVSKQCYWRTILSSFSKLPHHLIFVLFHMQLHKMISQALFLSSSKSKINQIQIYFDYFFFFFGWMKFLLRNHIITNSPIWSTGPKVATAAYKPDHIYSKIDRSNTSSVLSYTLTSKNYSYIQTKNTNQTTFAA